MANLIKIGEKDLDSFLRMSSDFHRFWGEAMERYVNAQIDLLHRSLDATHKIVTAIGILAGFGFTAIGSVESLLRFFIGELSLFIAIALGLFWIAHVYTANLKDLRIDSDKKKALFRAKSDVLGKLIRDAARNSAVEAEDLVKLEQAGENLLKEFEAEESKKEPDYLTLVTRILTALLLLGGFAILTSFIPPSSSS